MNELPIIVITLTVLFLLFGLFKKLSPVSSSTYITDQTIKELSKKYLKYDLLQIGLLLFLTLLLTVVFYNLFLWLSDFRVSLFENTIFAVKSYRAGLIIASLFTAMLTASMLLVYSGKLILKNNWAEYLAYNNFKYGFNYERITTLVIKCFAVITSILIILTFDYFTVFRTDNIILNGFFSLGNKTYLYSDIKDISDVQKCKAPNGNILQDRHFLIEFKDGETWNSKESGYAVYDKDIKIIELIKAKSGLDTRILEFEEN